MNKLQKQPKTIHFEISERKLLLRIFDVAVVLVSLYGADQILEINYFEFQKETLRWPTLLSLYLLLFNAVFELYDLPTAADVERTFKNSIPATLSTTVTFLFTPYISPLLPERRLDILYFFATVWLSLILWRIIYIRLFTLKRFNKKILVIGKPDEFLLIKNDLCKVHPDCEVRGYYPALTQETQSCKDYLHFKAETLEEYVRDHQISEIIIAANNAKKISNELYNALLILLEKGYSIREYSQVYEEITHRIPVQHVGKDFYRYFPYSRSNQNRLYLLVHKLMDIIFALMGTTLLIVLLPFIFVGNLIGNRGTLFYKQTRVGKNNQPYRIYKLRTMVANAEKDGAVWAQKNDTRVTPFGRFLRRSRIDELPQLINVLRGEMSVIGPRPERPEFVDQLSKKIPFYQTRHIICPGITGWAQVKGGYTSDDKDALQKLQYDLFYLKHRSFYLDLIILVKTFSTVIFFRGQ